MRKRIKHLAFGLTWLQSCMAVLSFKPIGAENMKIGDLVKHWRCNHGLGLIIDTSVIGLELNHKVQWPDGELGWYSTDRLQKVVKCK